MAEGLYIPTFIANEKFQPAIINPRVFFYNGKRDISPDFKISGLEANLAQATIDEYSEFPYFDHYSAADANTGPTSDSESLLFFNEGTAYGSLPSETLYTKYWQTYIELLYNPKTRFVECEANLPFALYVDLKLNDVVLFKGSHYHLRAINDYNLKTGDCNLQLLGPIIKDSLDNQ